MGREGSDAVFGGEARQTVSRLNRVGRCSEAITAADKLLIELDEPHEIVGVLLAKLAALLNLNLMLECPAVIDAAWRHLQQPGTTQAQLGEFHGMAADVAFRQGSLERCVTHLVRGARALDETSVGNEAMRSWLATATAYSFVGFHRQAVAAQRRAQEIAQCLNAEDQKVAAHPEIRIRRALFLDQQGETEEAREALEDVVAGLGPDDVTIIEQPYLGYASARRALLDDDTPCAETCRLLRAGLESVPEHTELRRLGEATLAITDGRPREALDLLEDAQVTHTRLGRAEIPRLRTFAHRRLGDYAAAYAAQCEVTVMLARAATPLYDLFVDGITVRIDYDELLRNVSRYADEAHTDPLTGLPNRRHLERHVAELIERGGRGTIGVCDLDRFKEVNTVHGHLVGDEVLQLVAATLSRTLRSTDFLARFAGDEFVVVLADTGLPKAQEIADRLTHAIAEHNWEAVVPGTPITLTIGLAELDGHTSMAQAFRAADLLMLSGKQR